MSKPPISSKIDTRFLEPSPFADDGGEFIGKDPRNIPISDLRMLGHPESPIKAIRANCLDCAGSMSEVRKCVMHDCPMWPLRMGINVFHKSRNVDAPIKTTGSNMAPGGERDDGEVADV